MTLELNISPVNEWLQGSKKPIIISGPCSAESEEQMMSTAKALATIGTVDILRAGIWKPRSRPDSFEGVGAIGLKWLRDAGKEMGVPVTTEVANARHVEDCLDMGIDILWIGARTTVNPFYVQEIADALKGVDVPVLVKNPINPDINLWIGALERINKAGITRLAAIHRGFSSFEKNGYRNAPKWGIPIELKTLCPELNILCDPSHIAGDRELIFEISQKALDLDMAGLMIESHISPDDALSDASQQVTPERLEKILTELTVRNAEGSSEEFSNQLEILRSAIDEIDADLLQKFMERIQIIEKIGEYKLGNNVTILQLERWKEILSTRSAHGENIGLHEEFVNELLKLMHKESIRKQTAIMNKQTVE